jgi:1-deoxy-D-xylulose-5-phosphate synthase
MTTSPAFPLLELIDTPLDLRQLSETRLPALAHELREFLIQTVARTGGHFSANLGAVELTIALHYVFNTPEDRLVWDVGHQTYPHKILTGRRTRMGTLRRKNGIAGFPRRSESPYDCFGVGHSSTSVSAALGMAIAAERAGNDRRTVAIIGDGAMTAGMAFEALNHAGHLKSDLLVVLNDNEMSISPNVGALSAHLTQLLSSRLFSTVREGGRKVLSHVPPMLEVARRAEEHVKGLLIPEGTLFEELGFKYFGPVDGHDLPILIQTLRNLRALTGPRLLHVVTRKGKGYPRAEDEPVGYHGVGVFDPACGLKPAQPGGGPTYTQVFGEWLCDMAAQDERLIGITPAMREGSGLVEFAERFPDRYFDVAIAEQHAVTFAAGLACDGLKPVVAIYSTFLQRAYDQLIHDVALQNLPVLFAIDRAGLVGPDGPTHAGSFDDSFLRCIPNLVIMAPADENECRQMLYTGFVLNQPVAVRYPRGPGPGVRVERELRTLPVGQAEIRRRGRKLALLAFGSMVAVAEAVAERLDATVVNMRFIKPLDEALIVQMAAEHPALATLEENVVAGGAGSAVNECLAARGILIPIHNLGLPDRFVGQGERGDLLAECGLDIEGVFRQLTAWRGPTAERVGADADA